VLQNYLGGKYTLEVTADRLDQLLDAAVNRLITDNPQWNFDKNWDILPDKLHSETGNAQENPPFVRFIPYTLLGSFLVGLVSVIAINRRQIWRAFCKKKGIYPFIIPTFLLLVTFSYYPIFSAFYHSLFDWMGDGQSIWVGLANFKELFSDPVMGESSVNAVKLILFGIAVSVIVPLAAAELIFHIKSKRIQYIYRVLFVVPMVVPIIVILLIWGIIYDYEIGVINQLMRAVGLGNCVQAWLADPKLVLYSLMFLGFPWVGGFSLLIYSAGLQGISHDVLDSCKIDGASGLRRIFHIDIPLIMGQIKLLVVLGFIGGVQGFQTQLLLTGGGPGYASMVPGMYLYENAITYDRMGYACAIGVVLFIIVLTLTYANMKYLKSSTEYEAK